MRTIYFVLFTLAITSMTAAADKPTQAWVYFGTYSRGASKGIYVAKMDLTTGKITEPTLAAETKNPSFLAIHPNQQYLYAVNEVGQIKGEKSGGMTAFSIDPKTGKLTKLNEQLSKGGAPCHLVIDATGKNVLVANYTGGNIASLPIGSDGKLGQATGFVQHKGSSANPRRQKEPHAHSINLDANNRYAYAADLGLDRVLIYKFNATEGTFTENEPAFAKVAPGSGPRHFALHPNQKSAYVINELKSTVTAFRADAKNGGLTEIQTISTLPASYKKASYTAEVQVHRTGKFLYGSNRGHDSIATFSIGEDGKLTSLGQESTQGKTPRNFGMDPTGKYLLAANQGSDSVVVFEINPKTGKLKATGEKLEVPVPVCV